MAVYMVKTGKDGWLKFGLKVGRSLRLSRGKMNGLRLGGTPRPTGDAMENDNRISEKKISAA